MHLLSASCVCSLLIAAILHRASGVETIIGRYGETLEIPCNKGAFKPEDVFMTKWKYDKGDGVAGDLLVKQREALNIISDEYKSRVSLADNSSLMLSEAALKDERTFTCMVVSGVDIQEYPVNVLIHKVPAALQISDKAVELEIGKRTKLGKCVAQDANPAATITWLKNDQPLAADGEGITILASVQVDPVTGLSTTSSTLEYAAGKEDTDAQFTCSAQHTAGAELETVPMTFTITYPTENIVLQVIDQGPLVEGDNVTLRCVADGNPAPTSFFFHMPKGDVVKVKDADTYTITDVTRNSSGEYKCSLMEDGPMESSKNLTVNYLDINLSPSGNISKNAEEALAPSLKIDASGDAKVTWTRNNVKLDKEPTFNKLTYSDSGLYECVVAMGPLSQKASFELIVEGAPVIRQLSKHLGKDGQNKVLVCEAEGSPKPKVSWSINGTLLDESPFVNGKVTHKITVAPTANLTVSCTVFNMFGEDTKVINVSSCDSDDGGQTRMVVGIVCGLLVASIIIGLAYWVYMKKSKQGSWKTGEKESGSSEEEKKLEEKVEENSQKAEV
ncbi:CD166 antigen homolog isoform X2 [Genypterus blacodes]|uniref:CD166 antigen homolog isoform X2 n=1 Tax=Genypterus blacodes TaxID=154954 RepID=UPI003F75D67C